MKPSLPWLTRIGALFCLVFVVAGCTVGAKVAPPPATPSVAPPTRPTASPPAPADTPFPTPAPLTKAAVAACPVSLPNGKSPTVAGAADFNHGNEAGTLFTIPWPNGTVIFAQGGPGFVGADGSLAMKWPWWRGVRGKLSVEGRRLDAPAPALRADINDAYGDSGFQPIALIFPTAGCWEVTGMAGGARLTFVTLAVRVAFRFVWLQRYPAGLVSETTDVSDLPDSLQDHYHFSSGGELIVDSRQAGPAAESAGPADSQKPVTVQGHQGTCAQGAFDEQRQWQATADAGFLEWTADGASYRISHKGLGLRCDDLLQMIFTPS